MSQFARKVTVLVRGHEPTASKHLVDAMRGNAKIEILTVTDLLEVKGSNTLEGIVIKNTKTNETQTCNASALFVLIGVLPQSQLVADLVKRSDKGYVFTGPDLMKDKKPSFHKASPLRTTLQGWTLERIHFSSRPPRLEFLRQATCAMERVIALRPRWAKAQSRTR